MRLPHFYKGGEDWDAGNSMPVLGWKQRSGAKPSKLWILGNIFQEVPVRRLDQSNKNSLHRHDQPIVNRCQAGITLENSIEAAHIPEFRSTASDEFWSPESL
jgi:hypothetical protein